MMNPINSQTKPKIFGLRGILILNFGLLDRLLVRLLQSLSGRYRREQASIRSIR